MDLVLFVPGALGALLTVYLAKQEVIPEFRPFYDTSEKEREVLIRGEHIAKTEKDIDEIQEELRKQSLPADYQKRLTTVLESSLTELESERKRLQTLERDIKQNQQYSRGLGFVIYILFGGVFAFLLADKVNIDGFEGELPNYFKAIIIGATWTSYLSTIGFRSGQKKADQRIEAGSKEAIDKINTLKKELMQLVKQEVEKSNIVDKTAQPDYLNKILVQVSDKIDKATVDVEQDMSFARQMVQRDVKGVL